MNEYRFFKASAEPDITVSQIGISRLDWIYTYTPDDTETCFRIMKKYKFDILPALRNNKLCGYVKTKIWGNYSAAEIMYTGLTPDDSIYYRTSIYDAIRKFKAAKRNFFFLDNQDEIIGLVTIGNFNSKPVFLYIYNLIIQLEQTLGHYLYFTGITDDQVLTILENNAQSDLDRDVVKRFDQDTAKGIDSSLVEYLYLSQYGLIFNKTGLTLKTGYTDNLFSSVIDNIKNLRNTIAHPNKSLITGPESVNKLEQAMGDMHRLSLTISRLMENNQNQE